MFHHLPAEDDDRLVQLVVLLLRQVHLVRDLRVADDLVRVEVHLPRGRPELLLLLLLLILMLLLLMVLLLPLAAAVVAGMPRLLLPLAAVAVVADLHDVVRYHPLRLGDVEHLLIDPHQEGHRRL